MALCGVPPRRPLFDLSKSPPVDPLLVPDTADNGPVVASAAVVESKPTASPPKRKAAKTDPSVEKIELPPSLRDEPDPDMF